MQSFLNAFDFYVEQGLKPVAVFKGSKKPVCKEWNKDWSIQRWRPYFTSDKYNIGLLLGEIIDVEADSEESKALLEKMIGNVKRPMFRSAKSTHNFFVTPDRNLTFRTFGGIEFRGYSVQSVVPPSFHEDGVRYRWLDSSFPAPAMPSELLDFFMLHEAERNEKKAKFKELLTPKPKVKPGHRQSVCHICHNSFYIHEKRLILEVKAFREYGLLWQCHGCREIDLRPACRRIRKEMQRPTRYVEPYASILEGIETARPRR